MGNQKECSYNQSRAPRDAFCLREKLGFRGVLAEISRTGGAGEDRGKGGHSVVPGMGGEGSRGPCKVLDVSLLYLQIV